MNCEKCLNIQANSFIHAMKAEWVKGRRTFVRYSAIMLPFLVLPFSFKLTSIAIGTPFMYPYFASNFIQEVIVPLMNTFPLYCIFIAIFNFHNEHTNMLWKHLNAQPVSGVTQALAKHFYSYCCIAFPAVALSALSVITLLILKMLYPELIIEIQNSGFWFMLCKLNLVAIIPGMAIVSILNVLAARLPGYGIVFVFGFFIFLLAANITADYPIAPFLPWTMGAAWLHCVIDVDAAFKFWYALVPIFWIALALAVHVILQRKRPLY